MADDDRSADIEDLAEDAVNELLGMYGYEGLDKSELKASLKKRGLAFGSQAHFPQTFGRPNHLDRFVAPGQSKNAQLTTKAKASKVKGQPAATASAFTSLTPRNLGNAMRNSQLCEWCKKDRARVLETTILDAPSAVGVKLKFCSPQCLNAYKLDIFRRETEACLRNSTTVPSDSSPNEMAIKTQRQSIPEFIPQKSNLQKRRFANGNNQTKNSGDLWTSAVGEAKKAAHECKNVIRKRNPTPSGNDSKSMSNAKQQRSKRRSAPPRPHPYYALNKKYWLAFRGGGDETRNRDESPNEEIIDDSNQFAKTASSSTSPSSTSGAPKMDEAKTEAKSSTPESSLILTSPKSVEPINQSIRSERPIPETTSNPNQVTPASLTNLLSSAPLSLVWIPVPIPIPLPIPIPIFFSGDPESKKREFCEIETD